MFSNVWRFGKNADSKQGMSMFTSVFTLSGYGWLAGWRLKEQRFLD
jgi:hypothetical protein